MEVRSQHPLLSLFFFILIGKSKWPPWPLIGWDIFDFSSETTERNSTKVDRKQDLNILYQVCVFWPISKQKCHPGWSVKKVAHCTQVHVMWPFGPLVKDFFLNLFSEFSAWSGHKKKEMPEWLSIPYYKMCQILDTSVFIIFKAILQVWIYKALYD